jgi:L-asparaginase II
MTDPVLVEVTRGPNVESVHRGAIVVVDAKGKRRAAIGDVERRVFPRSAAKALQALPLVESGAADRYGFTAAELALACASHSAEPRHVAGVLKMLAAAGRGETDLECGGHPPLSKGAADALVRAGKMFTPIHDNCSGKHAGFICLACHLGVDLKGYVRPDHPAQREVTATLAAITSADPGAPGVDGCGIPAYAIPLDKLALAFARFITGEGMSPSRAAAARRLVEACMAEPFLVAGTGRFDTDALTIFGKRLFIKSGAEGVFCAAFPELGLGVAIKCEDGAQRGPETAVAAVIEAFLPMTDPERERFADRLAPPVTTRTGAKVGEIRPVAGLVAALRDGRVVS